MTDTPKATPGVCANRMYASIGGRCCAHCGQQIHHDGNGWRHIATKQAACVMVREVVADLDTEEDARPTEQPTGPAEPADGSIVAWFDPNGDLYVVMHRDDKAAYEAQDGEDRLLNWWFPVYDGTEDPRTWEQACADLDGFRGPVVLVEESSR